MRLTRRSVLLLLAALFVMYCMVFALIFTVKVDVLPLEDEPQAPAAGHVLCVLIPHRNRMVELFQFIPHMHHFLLNQSVNHRLFVLNQGDAYRFNRAMLMNVGFLESQRSSSECDYIVMHDIDLLPRSSKLSYAYRGDGVVYHIASPDLHPLYHYTKYVGGILMLTSSDFRRLDGMSNVFWGWGREDDEFYLRMKENNLRLERPNASVFVGETAFEHVHDPKVNLRDQRWLLNQRNMTRRRDRLTGLHNVNYSIAASYHAEVEGVPYHFLNILLVCDTHFTPYCVG